MNPLQEPSDTSRNKLANVSLWLAIGSCVVVYLGLGLMAFGGGFYSYWGSIFMISIWVGFPLNFIALWMALFSLLQQRTFAAALAILICISLYISWAFLGLVQA